MDHVKLVPLGRLCSLARLIEILAEGARRSTAGQNRIATRDSQLEVAESDDLGLLSGLHSSSGTRSTVFKAKVKA